MMLKNIKIIIWIFFIAISIIAIGPNLNPRGFVVTFVEKGPATGVVSVGEKISFINDQPATEDLLNKEYFDIVKLGTDKGEKFLKSNGTLGISFDKVESTNLKFGLDIKGGIRAVIEPNTTDKETINQIISTLQTRINVFGLRESAFRPLYASDKSFIEISIAGGTESELRDLLESQGKFEGKVPLILDVAENKTSIEIDKNYEIFVFSDYVEVGDKVVNVGESFNIGDIDFILNAVSDKKINVTSVVFTGEDVVAVFYDPQRSRLIPENNGYTWSFGIQISTEGAQKFSDITKNLGVIPGGYLESPIMLYLDNDLIDSLSISATLKGRVETEVSITGRASGIDEAVKERSYLQSILRSGALPASIEIVQLDKISPTLGEDFLKSAALAGLVAIIGVAFVVSVRYRKIKLVLPMVAVSLSEVLIVIGLATSIGWTIDLAAVAGIIASVGTGIDSQIIILDQAIRKEAVEQSLRQKLKHAFFIVFGAGGTVIAAMLPLFVVGLGSLRGFAIITILGVLVGILIARPAYGVIVERLINK